MNISIGTIARTAALALALTNQILSAAGKPVLPIEDSQLETLVTTGLEEQQLHPGGHQGGRRPEGVPQRRQVTIPRRAAPSSRRPTICPVSASRRGGDFWGKK